MTVPKPETFEDNIGVRLIRLAEVFARLAKIGVEQPWNLRNTDLRILNTLDGEDRMAISEISRRTHVDKAWISRSVRELEKSGLVEKQLDPADSRVSLAVLTDKGRALLEEIRPHVTRAEAKVLSGIKDKAFKRDLDRLLENATAILEKAEANSAAKRG